MSVKIIAENILNDDDFSSATEQDGRFIGQPDPDSGNTGFFRPVSKGDEDDLINDFSYDGTATGDGSTTTMVDSVLTKLGDHFLTGAIITFTSGANDGESRTITAFSQSAGTITWVGVCDSGAATFKWRWNGSNWMGRLAPDTQPWVGEETIDDTMDSSDGGGKIVQMENGNWLALFVNASEELCYRISADSGLTWGSRTVIDDSDTYNIADALVLTSGRILLYAWDSGFETTLWYSDDNGSTWVHATTLTATVTGACELPNGNVYAVYFSSTDIYGYVSNDGGITFSDAVLIVSAAYTQSMPAVCVAKNGDVICAYRSDEDSQFDHEIKCRISSDGGASWGSTIDVYDFVTVDARNPSLVMDISGNVFCVFEWDYEQVKFVYSEDNGVTWSAVGTIADESPDTINYPKISLLDGHLLVCTWNNSTDTDFKAMRNGIWKTWSSSTQDITVGVNALSHVLVCDARIKWFGNAGIDGDAWTFSPEYEYAMENVISDNPDKSWRSENDNAAINFVLDVGTYGRFLADGVAFFGCNMRTLDFQMHGSDSWGGPDLDNAVSFDITTAGDVDAVAGNHIEDAALMASYKDHELKGKFLRPLDGTDSGVTFRILDNVGDYIVLDTTTAHNIAANDTFAIFQDKIADTFTATVKEFMRVAVDAQHTYDDYYKIGSMIVGKTITLSKAWASGYSKTIRSGIEYVRPIDGGIIPIERKDNKRGFTVSWAGSQDTKNELVALYDYLAGKNLALIPDSDDMADVYLVKLIGDIGMTHWYSGRYNFSMTFEEV